MAKSMPGKERVELQEARVREALRAARDRYLSQLPDGSLRSVKLEIARRYSDRIAAAAFRLPDCDRERIEKLQAESRAEMHKAVQQRKSLGVQRSAATAAVLESEREGRRRQQERLAAQKQTSPSLNFVVLDTPALILPSQGVNLVKVAPAPWNNVAKLTAGWSSPYPADGDDTLSYVFAWRNPSSQAAVINVASYLGLNGYCDAAAGPGWTFSQMLITTRLNLFEWWNDPPTQPPYHTGQINFSLPFLYADGGGGFGVGDFEVMELASNYDVEYRTFVVPAGEVAVFMVTLGMYHVVYGDGYIDVDFASGDFQVMCPALVIAIV